MGKVTKLAAEVAAASREESEGVGHLNEAVARIDTITQKNASGAEETAAAAEELNAQAHTLRSSVAVLQDLVGGSGAPTEAAARAVGSKESQAAPQARQTAKTIRPIIAKGGSRPATGEISAAVRDDFFADSN